MSRLRAEDLTLAYGGDGAVVHDLSVEVPEEQVTVVVGPNACGKSTLLRALARLLRPKAGVVYLDGQRIASRPTKEVARELGLLPQTPVAPEGLTVSDLVARGRFPHQGPFQRWRGSDEEAVEDALARTSTADLRSRRIDELSGGQRQRVWVAMALAQETSILLLDEPTTFLDLAHRLSVLDLVADLNLAEGRTVVMVLHDLNEACRYAHHLLVMKEGRLVAQGVPDQVVTPELVRDVFEVESCILEHPVTGTPLCVPIGSGGTGRVGERVASGPGPGRLAAPLKDVASWTGR